jgi:hypothetical protein
MTVANKNMVNTYSNLFEGLDSFTKLEIIKRLSKSLKKETSAKDKAFYNAFGAFPAEQSAEEIIKEIKASRKFRQKDIVF